MTEWETIREEYAGSRITLRELSRKYGVSGSTLQHRAARERWKEARAAREGKPAALTEAVGRIEQLMNAVDKAVRMIAEQMDRMAVSGEVKMSELKAAVDVLKTARELYRSDSGTADEQLQKARELLGGVPDALDG